MWFIYVDLGSSDNDRLAVFRPNGVCIFLLDEKGNEVSFDKKATDGETVGTLSRVTISLNVTDHNEEILYERLVSGAEWSHTGDLILARGDGEIEVWDSTRVSAQPICSFHINGVVAHGGMALSPDGKLLAINTRSFLHNIGIYELATGRLYACVDDSNNPFFKGAPKWSCDGKQILAMKENLDYTNIVSLRLWTVCLWDDCCNHLFDQQVKNLTFIIMCIRHRLESDKNHAVKTPKLAMQHWLAILALVHFFS